MGLHAGFDRGGGCLKRCDPPFDPGRPERAVAQPDAPAGLPDHEAGHADVARKGLHPPGTGAMLPAIAIAARRAAALAAMHPAPLFAADGGGEAGRPGASACAAAGGRGEDFGLHGGALLFPMLRRDGRRS